MVNHLIVQLLAFLPPPATLVGPAVRMAVIPVRWRRP